MNCPPPHRRRPRWHHRQLQRALDLLERIRLAVLTGTYEVAEQGLPELFEDRKP